MWTLESAVRADFWSRAPLAGRLHEIDQALEALTHDLAQQVSMILVYTCDMHVYIHI